MDWFGYLVATFIAVFVLSNFLPLLRARQARGRRVPELNALLTDTQRGKHRLLVYFWSPTCGMCRGMTPVIDKLAMERGDVLKVNAAESVAIAKHFGVMATPSLALVEQGILKKLVVGAKSEPQIRALLEV
ncbi:MAG TPA: thioredoxin family protein [Acidiferrobacterales bacterium]|nr:thioredoxin family protein [Acidiferrobacterales bacterium]